MPRYPVFIPSKGRATACLTAKFLAADGVPFRVVVEPQERDAYAAVVGEQRVLVLPFSNLGQGSIPARNWIKDFATAEGHKRHWQLDDNIKSIYRMYRGKRIHCDSAPAFASSEDFIDRYENIAVAGLNYSMFIGLQPHREPAFLLNCRVYSCALVLNEIPNRWRGRYNEDTDLCLQVLADGWCTVLINAFLIEKMQTMRMKGGNTDNLYQGDGRLKMSRSLERLWPGVVKTTRRFGRPQHRVKDHWRRFDTQLIRRADLDLSALPQTNEYGMQMNQVSEIKSASLKKFMKESQKRLSKKK